MSRPSPLKRSQCYDLNTKDLYGRTEAKSPVEENKSFFITCHIPDYEVELDSSSIPVSNNPNENSCDDLMFDMTL